jgi:hypothetical protein
MAEDGLAYLHRQHREGQDKYTYFLLAVTASAVAFSVQKTEAAVITWSLIPMALAIISWGISFYFGCKNLIFVQIAISANYTILQLDAGVHPGQPPQGVWLEAARRGTNEALTSNIQNAMYYATWQFRLLIAGAGLFLIWHIAGIIIRTSAHV